MSGPSEGFRVPDLRLIFDSKLLAGAEVLQVYFAVNSVRTPAVRLAEVVVIGCRLRTTLKAHQPSSLP